MAKVEVTVCDVCRNVSKPTRAFRVRARGLAGEVDLCEDDAAPIEARLHPEGGHQRRRTFASTVKTLEEIEAMKERA